MPEGWVSGCVQTLGGCGETPSSGAPRHLFPQGEKGSAELRDDVAPHFRCYSVSMPAEPLRTTTYTLTSADALAWEQASARLTPLAATAFIVWLALCGRLALLLPPDWAGAHLSWSFGLVVAILISIGATLALLLQATGQWRAARRRVRRPQEVTLVEWPAHLDIIGAGLPRALVFPAIRATVLTRTHLFLKSDSDVVIIPRRAFPEEDAVEELSQRVTGKAKPELPPGSVAAIAKPADSPHEPVAIPSTAAPVEAPQPEPLPPAPPPAPTPGPDLVALAKALEPTPAPLPLTPAPAPASLPDAAPKVDPKPPSA